MKQDRVRTKRYRARGNGYPLSRDLAPRLVPVAGCKPLGRETRKHPPQQVRKLAASLDRFGFVLPILIDAEGRVVAGWGLVLAARRLGPQRGAGGQPDGPIRCRAADAAPCAQPA